MSVAGRVVASVLGLESSLELENQRPHLAAAEADARAVLQSLKKELACYSGDGYKAFRNTVLCQEKERLATLLIEAFGEDADGRDARLGVRGQYAQVRRLIDRPAELETLIADAERGLYDALTNLQNLESRIKAAKDREG